MQLILYDLDGTLVDTREDIARAANHMRAAMGLASLPREAICAHVGWGLSQLVQSCLGTGEPQAIEEGIRIYRAHYAEHLLDHTVLYPGAQELLEHFRNRRQAVVTNKPNPYSREILTALGVAGYFFEIVAGDSGFAKKPDPQAIQALMERAGVPAGETLLVGDSPIDVETGRRAGVKCAAVGHGFSPEEELEKACPDWAVRDLRELLDLARSEQW